ncbi:MAG TPA: ABC-F family ATP-binding cassette domain-containing protein [Opitutaceae bacterium]|nr:ABC-F family ATP-binding cassette domain-containing protein [Opitutaceae bacterium]
MIILSNISKSYGTRTLFSDVTLSIQRTDRLGLVGPNGSGKSTLFSIIRGEDSSDTGTVTWERGATHGFLPQESAPVGDESIIDIATDRIRAASAHRLSEDQPEGHEIHADDVDYTLEPRAKKVLAGLGFRERDFEKRADTFSGGWVMRAHLARLLVLSPTLLLLDEPTNHLDLEALLWFQDYLKRYEGGLLIISHDREFLNQLCTGIIEIRSRRMNRWTGNYDTFLRLRDEQRVQQETTFKNQQREIDKQQAFVDRFRAKASLASRAQSKIKHIARLEAVAIDAPENDEATVNFRFPQPPKSGRRVLTLESVSQAYGNLVVYRDLSLVVERGQRIVLVGPNGSGKSTLLKIIAGAVPIRGGKVDPGHNVQIGYFAQNRVENLNPEHTVLEEVMEMRSANPDITEQSARTLLGGFLFRKDDVFKKVPVLSGGEKSRLALAKLLAAPPNLLLMDEPTTHLDIPSIDTLVAALSAYEGTLIFISHDVYFIRAIARTVLHIHSGVLTPYAGNYDYYLSKSGATNARAAVEAGFSDARPSNDDEGESPTLSRAASGPKSREQRRLEAEARSKKSAELKSLRARIAALEAEIATLEKKQEETVTALESPETYLQAGRPQTLNRELSAVVDRLKLATAEWESAAGRLDGLERS